MELLNQWEVAQLRNTIPEFVQSFLDFYSHLKSEKVLHLADTQTLSHLRTEGIPQVGRPVQEVVEEMRQKIYANQVYLQHPRWFGFIPSPVSLFSWLGDIMTNAYDPHASGWLLSSAGSCIEQETVKWLCNQAGYPQSAGGVFVSGGSMANLVALTAARNKKLREADYGRGVAYVSNQTHSSVAKGLRIMGFRMDQIRKIPTDSRFRMDVKALEAAIREDLTAGRIPFAVIATAGTTNTGSVDPLREIGELCRQYSLWLHTDGAYGASVLVSKQYRHLLAGIQCSDSLSWDAHKWLMQTYSCSAVLVRDKMDLINCFHTHPEYLKDAAAQGEEVNFWDLGVEMTRPARSLKLWVTLQIMGSDRMGRVIDHGFQLAQWAQAELEAHANWEIVSPAQLAIVNFRFAPGGYTPEEQDGLNQEISARCLRTGYAGVLTTELKGRKVLRICAIHPEATEEDMRSTIRQLDAIARQLVAAGAAERTMPAVPHGG